MIIYIVVVVAIGIFEIYRMNKKDLKKEIAVYISLSLLAIALAIYYYNSSPDNSLSRIIMEFFNIEH